MLNFRVNEVEIELLEVLGIELKDYKIADLGCGTGILGIAAALCGCENVFLFDIDEDAIDIARQNVQNLNLENNIQLMIIDVDMEILEKDGIYSITLVSDNNAILIGKSLNLSTAFIYCCLDNKVVGQR